MNSFELLGSQGPFVQRIEHFQARQYQQEMAAKIEEMIQFNGTLVAESGTGTGKTYAYLVPALVSGRKVVVSTGTKYLQDQLFQRDIPTVRRILGMSIDAAILKGRANYLCLERLENVSLRSPKVNRLASDDIRHVKQWRNKTTFGDISEVDSCLLYTSPSPRDQRGSRMPSSA